MNRIVNTIASKDGIISIYFTAGYPKLNDTATIIKEMQQSRVDMIEIGLPFSDPLADGPTIQQSSKIALDNGMTTSLLFEQLKGIRDKVSIPLIIMGYFNPMMQYGIEKFCAECQKTGIDGLIIPDLPIDVYEQEYAAIFKQYGLKNIFLITPETSDQRIRYIDSLSDGFIYMVSSSSTTGARDRFDKQQEAYFERIKNMNLDNECLVGFGISNRATFEQATKNTKGAIIGSAFIKYLKSNSIDTIQEFVEQFKK